MHNPKNLIVVEKKYPMIKDNVDALIISDQRSLALSVEYLSQANKLLDALIEDKETLTKPLNASLKAIRAKYKPTEDALNSVISLLRSKQSKYQTQALKVLDEQKQAITDRVKAGTGNLSVTSALARIENLNTPEKEVSADSGSVKFVTVKKFEVVNLTDVPIEYHLANETAIRKAMLEGIELKGVKYWTEQSVRNSR